MSRLGSYFPGMPLYCASPLRLALMLLRGYFVRGQVDLMLQEAHI